MKPSETRSKVIATRPRSIHKKAVLSQGEPSDADVNFDTYWSLHRHRTVFTETATGGYLEHSSWI